MNTPRGGGGALRLAVLSLFCCLVLVLMRSTDGPRAHWLLVPVGASDAASFVYSSNALVIPNNHFSTWEIFLKLLLFYFILFLVHKHFPWNNRYFPFFPLMLVYYGCLVTQSEVASPF